MLASAAAGAARLMHLGTMDIVAALERRGGVAQVRTLVALGVTADRVERAARNGAIRRIRPGVYAAPTAPADVVRAARIGGRLTGASAARAHGLWVPPNSPLTVELARGTSRLRDPDDARRALARNRGDVRLLWTAAEPVDPGVAPLADVLRACVVTLPPSRAVAVLDSALRAHPLDAIDLEQLRRSLPARLRWICDVLDARSESGTESILRFELFQAGMHPLIQMPVPFSPLERIDILVADRVAIECDSGAHHGQPGQRLRDLRRDAQLTALGFHVLRFDYAQVLDDLDTVLAAVHTTVANLAPRHPRGW